MHNLEEALMMKRRVCGVPSSPWGLEIHSLQIHFEVGITGCDECHTVGCGYGWKYKASYTYSWTVVRCLLETSGLVHFFPWCFILGFINRFSLVCIFFQHLQFSYILKSLDLFISSHNSEGALHLCSLWNQGLRGAGEDREALGPFHRTRGVLVP